MRIGIVTGEYPPMQGGVGAFTHIIAHKMADSGHIVRLFSRPTAHDAALPLAITPGWGIPVLWRIRQWARDHQLDVINVQFQTAAFDMSAALHLLPQVAPVPVITTFHDLRHPYLFPKAGPLRDWIVMHLARTSAGVIVTNHEDAARVAHLPHNAIIAIGSNILTPSAPDNDAHRRIWRERANVPDDAFLLAYFGFINHSKGVDTLLQALAQLDFPAHLLIIGGRTGTSDPTNAAYADHIDVLIAQLGLQSRITWTGFVDDEAVSAYLGVADVVVLPFRDGASYRRGTLMAAIHHGCPIITTEPAVHIAQFDGLYRVPPQDAEALAAAITRLHQHPDQLATLRQAALNIRQYFDWDVITTQTLTFFEQVVSK